MSDTKKVVSDEPTPTPGPGQPSPMITDEGFLEIERSFGRGSTGRKLLVSKPITLKQIYLSAEED